jgi:hypothetical protein
MNQRIVSSGPWRARRGNILITCFVFVLAMTVVVSGVTTMLKNQMEQSLTIKGVFLGRSQAYYLAEMGVNQAMLQINQGAPPADQTLYDFTNYVAMTRPSNVTTPALPVPSYLQGSYPSAPANYAYCVLVKAAGANSYQAQAQLKSAGDATVYQRVVQFQAANATDPLGNAYFALSQLLLVK